MLKTCFLICLLMFLQAPLEWLMTAMTTQMQTRSERALTAKSTGQQQQQQCVAAHKVKHTVPVTGSKLLQALAA